MKVALPLLALTLALTVALAGCMDDENPAEDPSLANTTDSEEPPVDTTDPMKEAPATGGADDPGSKAHKHDYWGDNVEINLVDADIPMWTGCMNTWDNPSPQFSTGCYFLEMGNGSVVYQGTKTLTLTASWDEATISGIRMTYRDAVMDHSDSPVMLENGIPLEIPVTPETADLPHSKQSRWAFEFWGGGSGAVGLGQGTFHVLVTIHRGLDLPLDPPHPDFWGNKTELDLGTITGTLKPVTHETVILRPQWDYILLPEGQIVPPGTGMMTVHFTWAIKDPVSGFDYQVMPLYASAQNPWLTTPDDGELDEAQGTGMFTVMVAPEMTDSPYATASQWRFSFWQGQSAGGTPMTLPTSWFGGGSPLDKEIEYTWHVVLAKSGADAMPMDDMDDE